MSGVNQTPTAIDLDRVARQIDGPGATPGSLRPAPPFPSGTHGRAGWSVRERLSPGPDRRAQPRLRSRQRRLVHCGFRCGCTAPNLCREWPDRTKTRSLAILRGGYRLSLDNPHRSALCLYNIHGERLAFPVGGGGRTMECDRVWTNARLATVAPDAAAVIAEGATTVEERPAELVYRMGFNPLHARVWRGQ